jgi:hypothetical protein
MARRRKPSGLSGERKFIDRRLMRTIRWDLAVARRRIKADGREGEEYPSLHAWGCGCCFLVPVQVKPAPR